MQVSGQRSWSDYIAETSEGCYPIPATPRIIQVRLNPLLHLEMGTCQSRAVDHDGLIVKTAHLGDAMEEVAWNQKPSIGSLVSPSEKTNATAPETPSNQFMSPDTTCTFVSPRLGDTSLDQGDTSQTQAADILNCKKSSSTNSDIGSLKKSDYNEGNACDLANKNEETFSASMSMHVNDFIPSKQTERKAKSVKENDHLTIRSQRSDSTSAIQQRVEEAHRMRRICSAKTTPGSIVFHPAPLIAPPKSATIEMPGTVVGTGKKAQTSVTPQIIANFNRLKIQVQLAEKSEMHRRRKAKLEDRFEDVKGYRNLWKDFEALKEQIKESSIRRSDELDTATVPEKSIDLKEPTSWYFDFQALQLHRHLDGEDDNHDTRSETSMSLLSGATMEAQRKYYNAKSRMTRNVNRMRPKKSRTSTSDDKSVASARSIHSRGSTAFLRGKTDPLNGDYGPIRDGDNCTVDFSYIGSDDSTPRTRTGRTITDDMSRATLNDDAASIVSELEYDNDYNVPRRRRRRNFADDSSLDTFDDRSLEGFTSASAVEFDMTDFLPRVHDETQGEHDHSPVCMSTEKPSIVQPPAKTYSGSGFRHSRASRIEQYGFDPSAPLSSQLEIFAQCVPSVEIDSAKTGLVRWRKFPEELDDDKTPTPRRLDGVFGMEYCQLESEKSYARHEPVETLEPVEIRVDSSIPQADSRMPESDEDISDIPTNIQIVTNTPVHGKSPLLMHSSTVLDCNTIDAMSPSHFLMMSSCHAFNSCHGGEEKLLEEKQNDETRHHNPSAEVLISVQKMQSSLSNSVPIPIFDPIVSAMPTEQFLQMSSWYPASIIHHDADTHPSQISDDDVAIQGGSCEGNKAMTPHKPDELVSPSELSPQHAPKDSENKSESREDKSEGDPARTTLSRNMIQFDDDFEDISGQVVEAVDNLLEKFRKSS